MKKLILFIINIVVVGACTGRNGNLPVYSPAEVVENEFLFQGDQSAVKAEMAALKIEATIDPIREQERIYRVLYSGKTNLQQIADRLDGKVEWLEPNFRAASNTIESRYEWPEDKYFFNLYALNNIGQSAPHGLPGKNGADMKVLEAWAAANDTAEVVVAVIDTGIDYNHTDLKDNMWVNPKEASKNGGIAGRDEDGNGYVDDIYGFDFVSSDRLERWYGKKGDFDPHDDNSHGSHVAGGVAAARNNRGVVGVNPKAKLMAVKVLDANGSGSYADIAAAIYYAVEMKADILQMSLGGSGRSRAMEAALDFAEKQGALVVAAAGNSGVDMDLDGNESYPAGYDHGNIVSVGASDNQDNPAGFSNYGFRTVDVFAPGVQILSTTPQQCLGEGDTKVCRDTYAVYSGTSMAAPYVSGIASLIIGANPGLKGKPDLVKKILIETSDRVPALFGKAAANGRVNALQAVKNIDGNNQQLQWVTNEAVKVNQRRFNDQLVDIRVPIEQPGAKALRIHFDFIDVDTTYDNLYVYDRDWKLIAKYEGEQSRDFWSPVIIGDKAFVRFTNAKIKKVGGKTNSVATDLKELNQCLTAGGENAGPVIENEVEKTNMFWCAMDTMEIAYEDVNKDVDDPNVFFNFNSDGFSIDKIEYTEGEI